VGRGAGLLKQFTYTVTDPISIHARPAGLLAKFAKTLDSTVIIARGDGSKSAEAKKLMAVMSLGVKTGETIVVTVDGDNEGENAVALEQFFKENL
jgi:phosphocarrier protein